MSRWSTEVVHAVGDLILWVMNEAMHKARTPLDHLMRFCYTPGDRTTQGCHVYRLAAGDAYMILGEFNNIVQAEIATLMGLPCPEHATLGKLNAFGLFAALFHAAYFHRRIMLPLSVRQRPGPRRIERGRKRSQSDLHG